MEIIKKIFRNSPLYNVRADFLRGKREQQELAAWQQGGRLSRPPQSYKQLVIREFGRNYGINTFIETGTFYGDTVFACRKNFRNLYSIELDQSLYKLAVKRFEKNPRIKILHGDSGSVLNELLKTISEKALFWLDGHYSEGITAKGEYNTPIINELRSILTHQVDGHVILIDDARCFTGVDDYPTLEALERYVNSFDRGMKFEVEHDLIRIYA